MIASKNVAFAPLSSNFRAFNRKITAVFNLYLPESIQTPDNYGMLPFHHACLNEALSLEVLMLFVSLLPEN